jgi:ubiquinone/menaquinone biosynthesis C-methylase UbiE
LHARGCEGHDVKLNWAERLVVNNPVRIVEQRLEMGRLRAMGSLRQGATILEVGCGRGAGARLILKSFKPSRLYALDLDIEMVRMAKSYLSSEEIKRAFLHVGDALCLPFKDASMDAVFGFGVLHHVPNWRGSLAEFARVLKTGGVYFIEELYPALYQNAITKHILLHPSEDRFLSHDLRQGLEAVGMPVRDAIEYRKLGILGVAVKQR